MLTEVQIQEVWNRAQQVDGYDINIVRQDCCGAWIMRSEYGKTTPYGWEIDHVYPQSRGGDSAPENLRAMHWENNRAKGDDYPVYNVAVQAKGNTNENVLGVQFKINDELRSTLDNKYSVK